MLETVVTICLLPFAILGGIVTVALVVYGIKAVNGKDDGGKNNCVKCGKPIVDFD